MRFRVRLFLVHQFGVVYRELVSKSRRQDELLGQGTAWLGTLGMRGLMEPGGITWETDPGR